MIIFMQLHKAKSYDIDQVHIYDQQEWKDKVVGR